VPQCWTTMRLHVNKPGMRVLGVAESFRKGDLRSTLAGIVMRRDLVVDGFTLGRSTVGGDDVTAVILAMFRRLHRNDVNLIMLSGCILSEYNVVDVDELAAKSGVPVMALTFRESRGIAGAIRRHFGKGSLEKLERYRKLGPRVSVTLKTGHRVFIRSSGAGKAEAAGVIDSFTLQGSIPEPVRVAKLLARAIPKGS
jgi:endonuclease V-like protein UPF0215 family